MLLLPAACAAGLRRTRLAMVSLPQGLYLRRISSVQQASIKLHLLHLQDIHSYTGKPGGRPQRAGPKLQ